MNNQILTDGAQSDCLKVDIQNNGQCIFRPSTPDNLLMQMGQSGVSPVLVGCKRGGCGKCRVKVTEGRYISKKMSRAHITPRDEEQSIVLACRITPCSDIRLIPLEC